MLSANILKAMSGDNFIDSLPFFKGLNKDERLLLAPFFSRCEFPAEAAIFTQGSPADHFYLLLRGDVNIRFKPYDGPDLTISQVKPGGIFGWSAALGSPSYTTSAVCLTDCHLLRMLGSDLYRLYRQNPAAGEALVDLLADGVSDRYSNARNQVVALLEYGIRNLKDDRRRNYGNPS